MNNTKSTSALVFFTVVLTFLLNIFFGRFLATRLSLVPLFSHFKILSPETPIVITQRQEIHTADSGDLVATNDAVKPRISLLVSSAGGDVKILGGALNVTSDGWFITAKSAVGGAKPGDLKMKLDSGAFAQVTQTVLDPATNIVFIKADAGSLAAVNFAKSSALQPGEKIVLVLSSMYDHQVTDYPTSVTKNQNDSFHSVFRANNPSRTFSVQSSGGLIPGQAAVAMSGDVVGMWDGQAIISSDVMKDATNRFLSGGQTLARPDFGFAYKIVTASEHTALGLPEGAELVQPAVSEGAVATGSPAQKAGLLEGDVIVGVNGSAVDENNPLESVLELVKPGDVVSVSYSRTGKVSGTTMTAGILK